MIQTSNQGREESQRNVSSNKTWSHCKINCKSTRHFSTTNHSSSVALTSAFVAGCSSFKKPSSHYQKHLQHAECCGPDSAFEQKTNLETGIVVKDGFLCPRNLKHKMSIIRWIFVLCLHSVLLLNMCKSQLNSRVNPKQDNLNRMHTHSKVGRGR